MKKEVIFSENAKLAATKTTIKYVLRFVDNFGIEAAVSAIQHGAFAYYGDYYVALDIAYPDVRIRKITESWIIEAYKRSFETE